MGEGKKNRLQLFFIRASMCLKSLGKMLYYHQEQSFAHPPKKNFFNKKPLQW